MFAFGATVLTGYSYASSNIKTLIGEANSLITGVNQVQSSCLANTRKTTFRNLKVSDLIQPQCESILGAGDPTKRVVAVFYDS